MWPESIDINESINLFLFIALVQKTETANRFCAAHCKCLGNNDYKIIIDCIASCYCKLHCH